MGVMDWITGTDGSESERVATDGLGFDEDLDDFDDGMDDFDAEMDDGSGGGMDEFGGGMDGLDGEMGGGFDDAGGGGLGGAEIDPDTIAEMEDRISELENEISSTTSEMNTVREENKQIGETVEELDDTVRKLLDIYEMVTRGINPFVDDAREMGGLESEGAFGLFEMEEETEDDLDPEVADADAEAFFDEDFGDIDAEEDEAELAAGDELVGEEREDPGAALDEEADEEDDAGGGTNFDELKSEYEENGGWDKVDDEEGAESGLEEAVEDDAFDADGIDDPDADESFGAEGSDADGEADDVEAGDLDAGDVEASDVEADGVEADRVEADEVEAGTVKADQVEAAEFVEPDPVDPDDTREVTPGAEANGAADGHAGVGSAFRPAAVADDDADAYLTQVPARYTAESVVLEWARFLVDVGGVVGATRALRQYREQGWITRRVERTVGEHVRNAAVAGENEETNDLRVRDHQESLTYISRLAGDVDEARLLEELSALGGVSRGIRR